MARTARGLQVRVVVAAALPRWHDVIHVGRGADADAGDAQLAAMAVASEDPRTDH